VELDACVARQGMALATVIPGDSQASSISIRRPRSEVVEFDW